MHCHQVREALDRKLVESGQWTREQAWRFPLPENLGMRLGAYERGERAISVPRLLRLADIYDVPSDQLLPRELLEGEINLAENGSRQVIDLNGGVTIDLQRLHDLDDPDAAILSRYATSIRIVRRSSASSSSPPKCVARPGSSHAR